MERDAYRRREIQAQSNGTSYTTFSCSIWTENHIEIGTRTELYVIVGHKVMKLYANDRARNKPKTNAISLIKHDEEGKNIPIGVAR